MTEMNRKLGSTGGVLMNKKWIVDNSILCITDVEDQHFKYIPRAEEIYYCIFGGEKPKNYNIPEHIEKPQEQLPDIRFSRLAANPKVLLTIKEGCILCQIIIERSDKYYNIFLPENGGTDHIIIDKKWVYLSSAYNEIVELFLHCNIHGEKITFSSYVKLLQEKEKFNSLEILDEVNGHFNDLVSANEDGVPSCLNAVLYPYQEKGFKWLNYITNENCGCILGDEMGLGKTLQVITLFIKRNPYKQTPFLVVAPISLLENWKREINRFAPTLSVFIHHGIKRTGYYKDLLQYDVIITSYSVVSGDLSLYEMITWDILVLDEAQNIKSPEAIRTKSVKSLVCRANIAVTGTPFENHLSDLWSILDFTMPGCLGSQSDFKSYYTDDIYGAEKIEPILSALMLRRKVKDVANDLPQKVVIPQVIAMEEVEALRYEEERKEILASVNSQNPTLAMITKLRMFCTHPSLTDESLRRRDPADISTKYKRLCEIIDEIVLNGEKVILFTSFTGMFEIFNDDIPRRFNIPVMCINGSTEVSLRQKIVDEFSSCQGSALLVLNPRAAGTGLNITAANHVIHYNLEWNPALEDQATARAYRRGQVSNVFVYRLFYKNTVEEVVNDKIDNKRNMADAAVVGTDGELDNRQLILKALMQTPVRKEE